MEDFFSRFFGGNPFGGGTMPEMPRGARVTRSVRAW